MVSYPGFSYLVRGYILSALAGDGNPLGALIVVAPVNVALFNGDPLGAGVEVAGVGYERGALGGVLIESPPGVMRNESPIEFPEAGAGGWGMVTHFALYDSTVEPAPQLLAAGILTNDPAITIDEGEQYIIPAEELVFGLPLPVE